MCIDDDVGAHRIKSVMEKLQVFQGQTKPTLTNSNATTSLYQGFSPSLHFHFGFLKSYVCCLDSVLLHWFVLLLSCDHFSPSTMPLYVNQSNISNTPLVESLEKMNIKDFLCHWRNLMILLLDETQSRINVYFNNNAKIGKKKPKENYIFLKVYQEDHFCERI